MIDLRSDTATLPSDAMRDIMHAAKLGDACQGEDPEIKQLEEYTAKILGKDASRFLTSGTQSNLTALLSHCERGDEYISGQNYHCYKYEGGGAAIFGSIQPQPIKEQNDGTLNPDDIIKSIKPSNDAHYAKTTISG